jgi:hypothetical protein
MFVTNDPSLPPWLRNRGESKFTPEAFAGEAWDVAQHLAEDVDELLRLAGRAKDAIPRMKAEDVIRLAWWLERLEEGYSVNQMLGRLHIEDEEGFWSPNSEETGG